MTEIVGDPVPMSRRDVEQWLLGAADVLASLGVRGVLGLSPDLPAGGSSSWISFASALGCGRVVRRDDGSCFSDAHRHADGSVLVDRSSPVTTTAELAAVVHALTPPRS